MIQCVFYHYQYLLTTSTGVLETITVSVHFGSVIIKKIPIPAIDNKEIPIPTIDLLEITPYYFALKQGIFTFEN